MEEKVEREWKEVICPGGGAKTVIMVEWKIGSEKGRILKRTLRQIDCHHSELAKFGGTVCRSECEKVIAKRER